MRRAALLIFLASLAQPSAALPGRAKDKAAAAEDEYLPEPKVERRSKEEIAFESEGLGEASRYERMLDAEERAEQDALARALRVAEVDISAATTDLMAESGGRQTQVAAQYIQSFSRGAASWKRTGPPKCTTTAGGSYQCRIRVTGKIAMRGSPDPSFDILTAKEEGLGLSHVAYRHGEPVELALRVSKDAALYLFSVDEQQNAYLIVPNKAFPANTVKAGETFRYPPKDAGLSLIAALPDGKDRAVEVLHIIATKGKALISLEGLAEQDVGPYKAVAAGRLGELMARLSKLDRDKWTMAVLPYEIRR